MIENYLDIFFAVVIAVSVIFGLFRGLFHAVLGIISLVLAFYLAKLYAPLMFGTLFDLLGESAISVAVAYIFVFLLVWLLCGVAASFFHKLLSKHILSGIDNIGGILFGFLRGVFYSILATTVLALTPLQNTTTWQESIALPMVGIAMQTLFTLPKIKDYKEYWSFNNNRPQFKVKEALGLKFSKIREESRDNELDKLIEEGRRHSLHGNQVAEDMAMQHYEKNKETTPLQAINVFLRKMISNENAGVAINENCQEGEQSACAE